MFIKEITVNGFKAFAQKETLNFSKGICALVGPNGSGKSNIIDAIKWVIGEQKVSELRGERMEDLIFNGSQKFKASNFAEVELLFNNSEKSFPIEYEEFSIKRRMFRSGESEFFINKQNCRLKDIQDIFIDSGLGKSSYAIIPQGKIDQILSEKVEEKRRLFEEAAAIAKFRERKKEYENKIARAQENLVRVDDLLKQSQRRRGQLAKQSGDTAKYFEYNDSIKKLNIDLLLHELFQKSQEKKQLHESISKGQNSLAQHQREITQLEKIVKELSAALDADHEDINNLEKEKIRNDQHKATLLQEKQWYEEGIRDIERTLKTHESNFYRLSEEQASTKERINSNFEQIKANEAKITQVKNEIKKDTATLKITTEEQTTLVKENEILAKILINKEKERSEVNEQQQKILLMLIKEIDGLKKNLEQKNILQQQEQVRKKVLALVTDLAQLNIEQMDDRTELAKLIELQNRIQDDFELYQKYFEEERSFYQFFFSAEGTYSIKEKLQKQLTSIVEEITLASENRQNNEQKLLEIRESYEVIQRRVEQNKFNLSSFEQNIDALKNDNQEKEQSIHSVDQMLKQVKTERDFNAQKQVELFGKIKHNETAIVEIDTNNQKIETKINNFFKLQKDKKEKFEETLKAQTVLEKTITEINQQHQNLQVRLQLLERDSESIYEKGSYQCSVDLRQYEIKKLVNPSDIRKELAETIRQMESLGQVNPLAKEEFDQLNIQIEEIETQKQDILEAISDLEKVSEETLNKCREIFLETFHEVNENFSNLIKELFPGGEGQIRLGNDEDPLIADIAIVVQPAGKKFQKLNLFSGGERTLIVLAFIFAFFLRKPSPFCLLDEVDAALDSSNIDRFMRLLKKMEKYTQLLLISHNQKTMNIVDYIYGFSIKDGLTKVLSLKM